MIKIRIILGIILLSTLNYGETQRDSDLDGVPDTMDKCPQTPFLNEVNSQGCTVSILALPDETDRQDMTFSLGYGYSTNEDLKDREIQRNTNFQLNYYNNNWSYSLYGGYYTHDEHDGFLDTTFRIKKRIHLDSRWVLGLSSSIRLPTHDYEGNEADFIFASTLHYYPTDALSLFAGYGFTKMGDKDTYVEIEDEDEDDKEDEDDDKEDNDKYSFEPIQNQHRFHVGIGYFFTKKMYANLVYSEYESKFKSEHKSGTLSTTVYYKINQSWFASIYYKKDILDEDLHETLLFKVGYHFW